MCGIDEVPPRAQRTATQNHLDAEINAALTAMIR
jgi:hypothetical protein